jgi:hypothetical protein
LAVALVAIGAIFIIWTRPSATPDTWETIFKGNRYTIVYNETGPTSVSIKCCRGSIFVYGNLPPSAPVFSMSEGQTSSLSMKIIQIESITPKASVVIERNK